MLITRKMTATANASFMEPETVLLYTLLNMSILAVSQGMHYY